MNALLPKRSQLVDALFITVLLLLGLVGFHDTFGGSTYLLLGGLGVLLGLLLGHITSELRSPVPLVAGAVMALAVLLSGVVLPRDAVGGIVPSLDTLRGLGSVVVNGWKQLLTTVHPVGTAGNLLALPYLLGLTGAAMTYSLAQRVRPLAAPLVPAVGLVALSIVLGDREPAAAVRQGLIFGAVALLWLATRAGRSHELVVSTSRRMFRPFTRVGLLGLAALLAWGIGPHLPGVHSNERTVWEVVPPFDPGQYGSPLAEYRRYVPDKTDASSRTSVAGEVLFTVSGLGQERKVRLATLDAYDGLVWGASNQPAQGSALQGFARVGTELPVQAPAPVGPERTVRITIQDAYRNEVWVPLVGTPTGITFAGKNAGTLSTVLRYSLASQDGLVPSGLEQGDVIELTTIVPPPRSVSEVKDARPDGQPILSADQLGSLAVRANKLAGPGGTEVERAIRIGAALKATGYNTHAPGGRRTYPGHSSGRLAEFLGARILNGDDEQYTATMALMTNAVGVPARVVLTGLADSNGAVKGSSVHADVEMKLAGAGWTLLPASFFVPDKAAPAPSKQNRNEPPSLVIPPPLKQGALSSGATRDVETSPGRAAEHGGFRLPGFVVTAVSVTGPPIIGIACLVGALLGMKALRRKRRRTRGTPQHRVAMGWVELLDAVRDLGQDSDRSGTRLEQARSVPGAPILPLARAANAVVFGSAAPDERAAEAYWQDVERLRGELVAGLPRWRRWRVALNVRSLLPQPVTRPPHARPEASPT
jgi:hypothetical protein